MAADTQSKKKNRAGVGCLIVFALPFAAIGIFMAGLSVRVISTSARMQDWEKVPAQIVSAELEINRGTSTSYQAKAKYRYEYGGRAYAGSRVSVHSGADNIGSFQQDAYRELRKHADSGTPFRCYVDPADPYESVLYPEFRRGLLAMQLVFGLVFGAVGFGLMAAGIVGYGRAKRQRRLEREHPGRPWLWKPEWATGRIRSSNKAKLIFGFIFSGFWNLISWPIAILVIREEVLGSGNRVGLIVLLFPLIGLLGLVWVVRAMAKRKKFGESILELASVPGVVGGKLAGVVHVPVQIRPEDGFHVTLSCIRMVTSGTGKNRSTREHILWQDERVMGRELLERDHTRSAIPVLFKIPFDAEPTNGEAESPVLWRLAVTANVPGIDYSSDFEAPVFRTEESSPDFELDDSAVADYVAEPDPEQVVRRSGIRIEELPHGMRLFFPAARHKGTALGLTLFFVVWTGFLVMMLKLGAPILFPIIFGVFDLLLLFGVVDLWLGTSQIVIDRGRVSVTNGLLSIGVTRRLEVAQVEDVTVARGMQAGRKLFYGVKLKSAIGRPITVGRRLGSRREADLVADKIREALRLGR